MAQAKEHGMLWPEETACTDQQKNTGKGEGEFISIDEFCEFTGLKKESVSVFLFK